MELQQAEYELDNKFRCLDTYSVMELQPLESCDDSNFGCLDTYSVMELQRVGNAIIDRSVV